MMTARVEDILPACENVMAAARHVAVNHDAIPAYAAMLLKTYPLIDKLDENLHLVSDDKAETAAYILALDTINFGSGWFNETGLEYNTIARELKNAMERGKLRTPDQWATATPAQFSDILLAPMHPLLDHFAAFLRMTGARLVECYDGDVMTLLASAQGSAVRLANIVAAWDSFRDESDYHGQRVPFLKRAQILAADMNLAIGGFHDVGALTAFADNMVPHVLRYDDILTYGDDLIAMIDADTPLAAGGEMEVELRAAAIYAVDRIRAAAVAQGHMVSAVNIDHLLWHRGYEPDIYAWPRHRTLTTAY